MFAPHEFAYVTEAKILIGLIHAFEGTFKSHPIAFHVIGVRSSHRIDKILAVVHHKMLVITWHIWDISIHALHSSEIITEPGITTL